MSKQLLLIGLVPLLGVLCACSGGTPGLPAQSDSAEALQRIYVGDDPSCPAPRCFEVEIPLPTEVTVTENKVRIILPEGYDASTASYPVMYLLHDAPGDYRSWTQLGQAFEYLQDAEVIAVMPDGGGGNPGWYSDWVDGSLQWESFHLDLMMPLLEQHFRVLGDGHRAVAGPSMGGHGAMSYASRRPGLFAVAAGFSGAVDFLHLDRISALYTYLGNPIAGTPNGPIWGDPVTNFPVWEEHDPGFNIAGLVDTKVLIACGNGLPGGPHEDPNSPQLYAIEPILELMNQSFASALAAAGIEHETWFYGPGFHDWPYYRDAFAWALPQMLAEIAAN